MTLLCTVQVAKLMPGHILYYSDSVHKLRLLNN